MKTPATDPQYFSRSALPLRAPWKSPGDKALTVMLLVSVEYYEMLPPQDAFAPPTLPGGFGKGPYPDFRSYSMREYGNRVGLFRLLELFSELGLATTAAIDAYTARHRPALVRACQAAGWEIAAHGLTVTQCISSRMNEAQERQYIQSSLQPLTQLLGHPPRGWHGPEYCESFRTPRLLAEAGLDYVMDWPNDEQPYRMDTSSGPIQSLPVAIDLDDVFAQWQRKLSVQTWCQAVHEASQQLLKDGADQPRLLTLNLHPWLSGQAHRMQPLRELLLALQASDQIGWATGSDICASATLR